MPTLVASVPEGDASVDVSVPAVDLAASAGLPGTSVSVDEPALPSTSTGVAVPSASAAAGSLGGADEAPEGVLPETSAALPEAGIATSAALSDAGKRPSRRSFLSMSRKKKGSSDSAPLAALVRPPLI